MDRFEELYSRQAREKREEKKREGKKKEELIIPQIDHEIDLINKIANMIFIRVNIKIPDECEYLYNVCPEGSGGWNYDVYKNDPMVVTWFLGEVATYRDGGGDSWYSYCDYHLSSKGKIIESTGSYSHEERLRSRIYEDYVCDRFKPGSALCINIYNKYTTIERGDVESLQKLKHLRKEIARRGIDYFGADIDDSYLKD